MAANVEIFMAAVSRERRGFSAAGGGKSPMTGPPPAGNLRLAMLTSPLEIVLDLPREHVAATIARRRLRQDLDGLFEPQRLSDLNVVVSELVTNAVIHGHGAIRVRIEIIGGDVRGEVTDEGGGFEHEVREVGVDELRGRGLLFVQRFTSRWGVHEGTAHVWFEMLSGEPTRTTAGPEVSASRRPRQLPPRREQPRVSQGR